MLTLEEYCSQTVSELMKKAGFIPDLTVQKTEILHQCAKVYYQNGEISQETYEALIDPRFSRLYGSRVSHLKKLLAEKKILSKAKKPKIVQLCYDNGIDIVNIPKVNAFIDNSSSGESGGDEYEDFPYFILIDNKIYFQTDDKQYHITPKLLSNLMKLLLTKIE